MNSTWLDDSALKCDMDCLLNMVACRCFGILMFDFSVVYILFWISINSGSRLKVECFDLESVMLTYVMLNSLVLGSKVA